MSLFDELVACESGPQPGAALVVNIACDVAMPIIKDAYAIPSTPCPPGAEPDPPELVADRVAAKIEAVPIFGGVLAPEARQQLDAYVGVRYAKAFEAWHQRIQECAAAPPVEPPAGGGNGGHQPAAASFPVGAAFVLLGLGLIAAGRR